MQAIPLTMSETKAQNQQSTSQSQPQQIKQVTQAPKKAAPAKTRFNNNPLPLGTLLNGKYIVYKNISAGGYGIVYIAKWKDSFYAIKEFIPTQYDLRTDKIQNAEQQQIKLKFTSQEVKIKFTEDLATFFVEAQTASQFNHPNVVKIVDVFEENNTAYMVMPLEKGLNLFGYIGNLAYQEKKIADEEIIRIALQICEGLSFLHKQGFVHLDIKAGNILIRPNGQAVILDLGSCRKLTEIDELPKPAVTRGYAAPEIYNRKKTDKDYAIDQRTDIYAFGALLKVMIEGDTSNSPLTPAVERHELDATYFSEKIGHANHTLLKIVDKCMELQKDKRYNTIDEVKQALQMIKFARKKQELHDYFHNLLNYVEIESPQKKEADTKDNKKDKAK